MILISINGIIRFLNKRATYIEEDTYYMPKRLLIFFIALLLIASIARSATTYTYELVETFDDWSVPISANDVLEGMWDNATIIAGGFHPSLPDGPQLTDGQLGSPTDSVLLDFAPGKLSLHIRYDLDEPVVLMEIRTFGGNPDKDGRVFQDVDFEYKDANGVWQEFLHEATTGPYYVSNNGQWEGSLIRVYDDTGGPLLAGELIYGLGFKFWLVDNTMDWFLPRDDPNVNTASIIKEIDAIMFEPVFASEPSPYLGQTGVAPDVILSWKPGIYADLHDVYLGTNFDYVNNADTSDTTGVYRGRQDTNIFDPGGLELGTTYYWRIDEVNEPNIWKGQVWHFTVVPATVGTVDLFGINFTAYWPDYVYFTEDIASDLESLGVKWMRVEFIRNWNVGDVINFSAYDQIVDRAAAHGIQILGLLDYQTKQWSEKSDWESPSWQASFVDRVEEIVSHFAGRINCWEIWNEEDLPEYRIDPAPYGRLLTDVYDAIKVIDPNASVVFGGLSNAWGTGGAKDYLIAVYNSPAFSSYYSQHGIYPYDIMAVHPYCWTCDPETYLADALNNNIKAVMNLYGDEDKKVWLTELGWNSNDVGEQNQADYLTSSYEICRTLTDPAYPELGPYIRTYSWFKYNDDVTGGFGLIREDETKKPSYYAYDALRCWPADVDDDGDVDLDDYAGLADHWRSQDCSQPDWCDYTDLNKDGSVNMYDLDEFARYWLENAE